MKTQLTNTSLGTLSLSASEKKVFAKMVEGFKDAQETQLEACRYWVNNVPEERRAEIAEQAEPSARKRLRIIEGVGEGRIDIRLLVGIHRAADIIRTMTITQQAKLLDEGVPVLRNIKGDAVALNLHHEELHPDDIKIAFTRSGSRYRLNGKKAQLTLLKELAQERLEAPSEMKQRGFGEYLPSKEVFVPAPIRFTTGRGYTLEELENIIAEMKKRGWS